MCTSAPSMSVPISTPGISTWPGCFAEAIRASATPSVESWSVSAWYFTPWPAARSTSWVGVSTPSDAVLWVWKSPLLAILLPFPVDALDGARLASHVVDVDEQRVERGHARPLGDVEPRRHAGEEL